MADAAAAAAAATSYKHRKEAFVSNLSGGSVGEVFLVSAVAPVAVFAWSVLQRRQAFFDPYTPLAFAVDFFLNVGAILLATTLYAGRPLLLNGLLLASAVLVLVLPPTAGGGSSASNRSGRQLRPRPTPRAKPTAAASSKAKQTNQTAPALPRKPFITAYRGCMMVVTCLAILAVDFRIFPRRFAKVETWGTSLMDLGVGSFVFSAGVVGARPLLKDQAAATRGTVLRPLLAALRHALPLFVLGVVRLLSVKGLDYAEHVSEYGVHWNFFFTLGLLPPCVATAQALRAAAAPTLPLAAVALLLAAAYETALDPRVSGLRAFVLTAPRTDLLSQNREGLASFVGYLAVFLAGQATGLYVLRAEPQGAEEQEPLPRRGGGVGNRVARLAARVRRQPLFAWAVVWWALHRVAVARAPWGLGLTESRRLANLPYVLWVVSFNTLQLSMFWLADAWVFGTTTTTTTAHPTSRVLAAFNRNGLALFLVANLLTGVVNLTVPTLDASPATAMAILLAYGGALTGLAVGLDAYDVTIKL